MWRKLSFTVVLYMVMAYNNGPVDKSKNSAETLSSPGRIIYLETEKDGIYHPLKV